MCEGCAFFCRHGSCDNMEEFLDTETLDNAGDSICSAIGAHCGRRFKGTKLFNTVDIISIIDKNR